MGEKDTSATFFWEKNSLGYFFPLVSEPLIQISRILRGMGNFFVVAAKTYFLLSKKYRHSFCSPNSVETWRRFYTFCDHIFRKNGTFWGIPLWCHKQENYFDICVKEICLVTLILSLSKSNEKWRSYRGKRVEKVKISKSFGPPPPGKLHCWWRHIDIIDMKMQNGIGYAGQTFTSSSSQRKSNWNYIYAEILIKFSWKTDPKASFRCLMTSSWRHIHKMAFFAN